MGFLNTFRNIRRWFTDKTGITEPTKRKHDECETVKSKRARMDDTLVEVVEISDESLSEAEEVEITEPGPSSVPLRASPPVMLIGKHQQRNTVSSPVTTVDLTECSDEETKRNNVAQSYSRLSNRNTGVFRSTSNKSGLEEKYSSTCSIKGSRSMSFNVEGSFSALKISNPNNNKQKELAKILKSYVSPKSLDDSDSSIPRSPLSKENIDRENIINQSNSSKLSEKENSNIQEVSFRTNKIIQQELFYDRIIRKFKEQKSTVAQSSTAVKLKSPEDIFREKLEAINKELNKHDVPPKKRDVFPGYCQEIVDDISLRMRGTLNEFIINGKNLRRSDLKTLYLPTAWLNDEVINHYFNMIVDRDPASLHTFDTFFYCKLSSQGYQSVRRWSRKKDIFACKKMFCPIHLGNHWCLICVNFVDKTIKYYDSLKGKNPKCLDVIFYYLKEEYKNKKNEEFDCNGWRLMHADDCPQQRNGYDCGVFTCVNAEYLARNAALDFTQDDMPKLRYRLCYEIFNNKLCY